MQLEDECTLSFYREIAVLSDTHSVYLVQHIETRKIYVKKIMSIYNIQVFHHLKAHPIPNTPRIYEVIENQGKLIVIEEYLSGMSLQELLDEGVSFETERVIDIIRQLCEILKELHCSQPPIIHRDIKPSNIIISPDGILKLLDMNAAKYYNDRGGKDTVLMGTVGYAAPEQYGFGVSNAQTDLYAVGVLANMLLTGKLPQEELYQGKLGDLISKCTRLEPAERFSSVDELLFEMNRLSGRKASIQGQWVHPYAPPGFRNGKPLHMILSALGYYFLIGISLNITVEPCVSLMQLWLNRWCCLLIGMTQIFFWGNYLNIQDRIGISKIEKRLYRNAARLACSFMLLTFLMIILTILENIYFA